MPKGNHTSSKGGGGGNSLKCSRSAHKARISSSMSTKIWPWAAWTVITVSNIHRMSESSEVKGGGTATAATGSTDSAVVVSPIEEGGRGATPDGSTLGCLELALIWAAIFLRKVAPIGAMIWIGSDVENSTKPRCKRIQWIKRGKNRAWAVELLLWTSIKERMKRWGKLIGALVTRAYKNA